MTYTQIAIQESDVPRAEQPLWQHALDTYASEVNKVCATWAGFHDADLDFRPHPKSATVREIMRHELLSERRFFGEFLQLPEPSAGDVLPAEDSSATFAARLAEMAKPRLEFLARQDDSWWLATRPFFDVNRERIWIFWRRILHTAHHRTQLTVYLRLLDKPVPAIYGPSADVSWRGADPTATVEAAGRGSKSGRS
jgi:uncharacterized damage-inducible protein DinB